MISASRPTMTSAKRLAQLAKWRRMAVLGRKRIVATDKGTEECSTSVAVKGHCIMYTADGSRFEVPLEYLRTLVFDELLRMSQEFGFASDGRITLPCEPMVMKYVMCLLRRNASVEMEDALLSSMVIPCQYADCLVLTVGTDQQICCF